jgi:C-terminal processing protease CtpA/Prc
MVGRLQSNQLTVLGAGSAKEWNDLLGRECKAARLFCNGTGDGYGPSDQTPFYAAGTPVLHFFSGAHTDYHKPSDSAEKLNYAGAAKISELVVAIAQRLSRADASLTYVASTKPQGPGRGPMKVSLGTVPDYGGPPPGVKGMLIQGVRAGSPAEKAGIKRGDVLVRLGKYVVTSVEDLMTALTELQPGETTAAVLRDGKAVEMTVTLEEKK